MQAFSLSSSFISEDADISAPPSHRPKRREKIIMQPPGKMQGLVRLKKKGQHFGVVSGWVYEV